MEGRNVIEKELIRLAFDHYVSEYNADDPKIKLKIHHTYRVAELAETIAKEAGVDAELAWLCGMLHDIGRFEQVRRYNTFNDSVSVDHAEFGADLLFSEGLIDRFELKLSQRELQMVGHCIRYHSAFRLPDTLSDDEVRYSNGAARCS